MDSVECLEIELKDPSVRAGHSFCGTVTLALQEALRVTDLHVKLTGEAYTAWMHSQGHPTSRLRYIDEQFDLIAKKDKVVLPMGDYKYDFEFYVPHDSPPSFSGAAGTVKYKCHAVLDCQDLEDVKKYRTELMRTTPVYVTVLGQGVPNISNLDFKPKGEISKDKLLLKAELNDGFFSTEEKIRCNLELKTNSSVKKILLSLIQKTQCLGAYFPYSNSNMEQTDIRKDQLSLVEKKLTPKLSENRTGRLECELEIPASAVSSFDPDDVHPVKIKYELEIKVSIADVLQIKSQSSTLTLPIVIGLRTDPEEEFQYEVRAPTEIPSICIDEVE